MRPRGRERAPVPVASAGDVAVDAAVWPGGGVLASKFMTLLVVVLLATGPLSLGLWAATAAARKPAAAVVTDTSLSEVQQASGAYAVGFVGSWLTATRDDDAGLSAYIATGSPLSDSASEYRNIAAVSVQPVPGSTLTEVVVAADVAEPGPDETTVWPRRYFQVDVDTAGDRLAVTGYPAPVAGTAASTSTPSLGYDTPAPSTGAASQTAARFLAAYLAGQGDVTPYLSPGTPIVAVTPAPYTDVTVTSVSADETPADAPDDQAVVAVRVDATLETASGQLLPATYFLRLQARAGRWEISAVQDAPVRSAESTTSIGPTPIPSPSR